jgi:predicted ATP-grasp superfamily ATP-dependent carboligase
MDPGEYDVGTTDARNDTTGWCYPMLDPEELYELGEEPGDLARPVLVHALPGFVDAGSAGRLAAGHLLASLDHEVVARFDVDQLIDYRSRRPAMVFAEDHYEDYEGHELALYRVYDSLGTPFLLLTGPEPDLQWERFVAAVTQLVDRFDVRLSVGLMAIPMAVPHTRPLGVTMHGTNPDLLTAPNPWRGHMQIPANVGALLELRLGQTGHEAMGFAAHVPHYLSQTGFPAAAQTLLEEVTKTTGLVLPTGELAQAAAQLRVAIDAQVGGSEEVLGVVHALERQYDAFAGGEARGSLLSAEASELPSGDEIGAELERFLAELGDGGPDGEQNI